MLDLVDEGLVLSIESTVQGLVVTRAVFRACRCFDAQSTLLIESLLLSLPHLLQLHLILPQLVDCLLYAELLFVLEVIARPEPLKLSPTIDLIPRGGCTKTVSWDRLTSFIEPLLFGAGLTIEILLLRGSLVVGVKATTPSFTPSES